MVSQLVEEYEPSEDNMYFFFRIISKQHCMSAVVHCLLSKFHSCYIYHTLQGFVPAFIRLGPHTILTFVFLEQLRRLFPPK